MVSTIHVTQSAKFCHVSLATSFLGIIRLFKNSLSLLERICSLAQQRKSIIHKILSNASFMPITIYRHINHFCHDAAKHSLTYTQNIIQSARYSRSFKNKCFTYSLPPLKKSFFHNNVTRTSLRQSRLCFQTIHHNLSHQRVRFNSNPMEVCHEHLSLTIGGCIVVVIWIFRNKR